MTIMVVMAHPDDAPIWMGGTILKEVRRGNRCLVCSLTGLGNAKLEEESATASGVLESKFVLLDLKSSNAPISQNIVDKIVALAVEHKPEVVVTHWNKDTHPGHAYVFKAVQSAIVKTKIALLIDGQQVSPRTLYMCDSYYAVGEDGSAFQPSVLVDISDVWETKLRAIEAFKGPYLRLWLEMVRKQCEFYGGKCGVPYAEGFAKAATLASLMGGERPLQGLP